MEGQQSFNPIPVPTNTSSVRDQALDLIRRVRLPQIRQYVLEKWNISSNNQITLPCSDTDRQILDQYAQNVVVYAAGSNIRSSQQLTITPYNVVNVMMSKEYSVTRIDTLPDGYKPKLASFPLLNPEGYMVFKSLTDYQIAPIVNRAIMTDFLGVPGVIVYKHNKTLVTCTDVYASITSMKGGLVKGDAAHQAFKELLGMDHYVDMNCINGMVVGLLLRKLLFASPPPRNATWNNYTVKGADYAHLVYIALYDYIKEDRARLHEIVADINMIMSGNYAAQSHTQFMTYENGTVIFDYVRGQLPKVLAKKPVDPKALTPYQAHYALKLSRDFRGENSAEKGALTRGAYIGANVGGLCADICMDATTLKEMASFYACIAIMEEGKTGRTISTLFGLKSLGYIGTVVLDPSTRLLPLLVKYEDNSKVEKFRFKEADFDIVLNSNRLTYAAKSTVVNFDFPERTIIYDLNFGDNVMLGDNMITYHEALDRSFASKMDLFSATKFPIFTMAKTCNAMTTVTRESKVQVVSIAEMHNNMAIVTNGNIKFDEWRYNLVTELHEFLWCSLICNVARCVVSFTNVLPYVGLARQKKKIPQLWTKLAMIEPIKATSFEQSDDVQVGRDANFDDWFDGASHAVRSKAEVQSYPVNEVKPKQADDEKKTVLKGDRTKDDFEL